MSRVRQGRFARLLSVVASVALVGPILALSSPVTAYAEELAPTPPAVVETTPPAEPGSTTEPAASVGTPDPAVPQSTLAPEPGTEPGSTAGPEAPSVETPDPAAPQTTLMPESGTETGQATDPETAPVEAPDPAAPASAPIAAPAALAATASVSGRVLGADGNPLTDAGVYLYWASASDEWEYDWYDHVDENGYYSFSDIEPGDYKLRFRDFNGDHRDQWYQGKTSFAMADSLAVVEGPNDLGDVQLATGAKIRGAISYSGALAGQPVVDAGVRLYAWSDPDGDNEITDSWVDEGQYSLNRLDAGSYYLVVSYGALTHKSGRIEVADDEIVTLDLAVSPGASLSGVITRNGAPLADAWVSAWNKTGWTASGARTNAAGEYTVAALASGSYTISVYSGGSDRYLGGATTRRGATWVKLIADQSRTGVDLDMVGGGIVQGKVTGPGGNSVPDASVRLIGKNGITTAYGDTDENGQYTISGVPAGRYALRVNHDDYLGQWWNGESFDTDDDYYGSSSGSGDIYFEVKDGKTETKDVALTAYGRINGTFNVANFSENDLSVYLIAYLRDSSGGLRQVDSEWFYWYGTPADFEFTRLVPGDYVLKATIGYYEQTYWYPNKLTAAEATPVTVTGDTPVTMTVDFTKRHTGGISGTLAAPGADPSQTWIYAESEDDEVNRSVRPDSSGAFSLANLPPGKYRLWVDRATGYAETYYPAALNSAQATLVTVGSANVALGTWSLVASPGSVTGRVFQPNGTDPVTGDASATLYRIASGGDSDWIASVSLQEDGTFGFLGYLVPGERYQVSAWEYWDDDWWGSSAEFTATSGSTAINITVQTRENERGTARIEGTLTDGDEPVADVWLRAFTPDDSEWGVSRADGSYSLSDLRPGSYKVAYGDYSSTQSYYAPAWFGGTTEASATPVTVAKDQVVTGKNIVLTQAGRISGTLATRSGGVTTWLRDAPVSLYTAGNELLSSDGSGYWPYGPGGYGFTVPAGSYKICAQQTWDGTSTANCWSGGGALVPLASAATIKVVAGQDVDDIDLVLGGSIVAGTVTVSGTAVVGSTLTANTGTWSPSDVAFAYQWLRNGAPIAGATAKTYPLVAADRGTAISVRVTGSKAGLPAVTVTSAATAAVAAGALSVATPSIGGTALVGSPLSVNVGSWSPQPDGFSYEWLRAGSPIPGATGPAYTAVADDAGRAISVRVTGSKAGYNPASATSGAVTVAVAALSAPGSVAVSGEAKVNAVLTASPGSWGPAPVTVAFQWLRAGSAISGATASKYTVQAGDVGKALSVRVTGSKPGYATASRTSAATAAVPKALKLKTTPAPKIKGTVKVGSKLTVSSGTWKPKPVPLTVQWFRAGVSAPVATGTSYTLTAADKGKKITVKVTGAKVGYAPVTKSKTTKKVAAGKLSTATPKVTGTAKVGSKLTVAAGSWKPVPVSLGYQWLRNGKKIAGATGGSYVLTAADKGKTISVKVTGSKPGYATASKTSKKTKKIAA